MALQNRAPSLTQRMAFRSGKLPSRCASACLRAAGDACSFYLYGAAAADVLLPPLTGIAAACALAVRAATQNASSARTAVRCRRQTLGRAPCFPLWRHRHGGAHWMAGVRAALGDAFGNGVLFALPAIRLCSRLSLLEGKMQTTPIFAKTSAAWAAAAAARKSTPVAALLEQARAAFVARYLHIFAFQARRRPCGKTWRLISVHICFRVLEGERRHSAVLCLGFPHTPSCRWLAKRLGERRFCAAGASISAALPHARHARSRIFASGDASRMLRLQRGSGGRWAVGAKMIFSRNAKNRAYNLVQRRAAEGAFAQGMRVTELYRKAAGENSGALSGLRGALILRSHR